MEQSKAGSRHAIVLAVLAFGCILKGSLASSDTVWVTCGSTVKIAHSGTGFRLHSHQVQYSRGSQQQSVTLFPSADQAQSYWIVHGPLDKPCEPGTGVKKNQKIRLQHSATRRWLHSHNFHSPISNNQEVSCYGDDNFIDGGDVWTIEWDGKKPTLWKQDLKVRLKHVDTSMFLASHSGSRFGHPISGQLEVVGVSWKGASGWGTDWYAAEGIYMPRPPKNGTKGDSGKDEL